MVKLWKDLQHQDTWGEYYELYNVLDVTLTWLMHSSTFVLPTLKAFGVDPMHYITAPQMAFIRSS